MPPTTTALPLVIRASFLFSGMFGIQLDGLKDNNGNPITVQSALPLNLTLPTVVMNQITIKSPEVQQFPAHNRIGSAKCIGDCKANYNKDNNNQIHIFPSLIKSPSSATAPNNGNIIAANFNGVVIPAALLPPVAIPKPTTRKPPLGKPCGPGKCSQEEICVSWMKQTKAGQKNLLVSREDSPMMVHECLPNDGVHWTKMNPTGAKLCERGKTHSIYINQSQRNCDEGSSAKSGSCELIWHYGCVDEKDSPHSCALRQCPYKGACIEFKNCNLRHLCYVEAVCTPEFLIPDQFRHSLRAKTGK